jgi:hypothetical protein
MIAEPERFRGRRVGLVLCGGNIDPRILASIMMRELAREERIVAIRLAIPDRPGVLGDISTLLKTHPTDFYRLSMGHLFDLTPQAFADLRTPALLAAACFFVGFGAAWVLGRRRRVMASAIVLAVGMAVFVFAANLAFRVFEPHMSSRPLAKAMLTHLKPEDRLAIYGEFDPESSVSFYTHRKAWIVNGRYNNLELGSHYPDAPQIFLTDADFPAFWRSPQRTFLVVPAEKREEAAQRLPRDSTWLLMEKGGKAVYVNQPLTPGQPPLAQAGK